LSQEFGLVVVRHYGERVFIDLGPMIETAIDAAGSNGEFVRAALMEFVENDPLAIVTALEKVGSDRIRLAFKAARGIRVNREERHESLTAKRKSNP
jgi:hypothetical protein